MNVYRLTLTADGSEKHLFVLAEDFCMVGAHVKCRAERNIDGCWSVTRVDELGLCEGVLVVHPFGGEVVVESYFLKEDCNATNMDKAASRECDL